MICHIDLLLIYCREIGVRSKCCNFLVDIKFFDILLLNKIPADVTFQSGFIEHRNCRHVACQ